MHSFLQRINIAMSQIDSSKEEMVRWREEIFDACVDRVQMNRLVMDYLVKEGYKTAAEKFQLEGGVAVGVSLEEMSSRNDVKAAVQAGEVDRAVDLTNALNPELLDSQHALFFHLQQQKLVELVREQNIDGALEFAQNVLAELAAENADFLDELERTMALLAYDEPTDSPFGELLELNQREKVAAELNGVILEAKHYEKTPKLANLLKLLFWCQSELDKKHVKYPKLTDVVEIALKSSTLKRTSSVSRK